MKRMANKESASAPRRALRPAAALPLQPAAAPPLPQPAKFRPARFVLRDGRSVTLRAIAPADTGELVQAFERLSVQSRYLRFGEHKKELERACLERSTRPLPGSEFAVVATVPAADGYDIVGVAHYVPARDPHVCEFAVIVADDWQRGGLAKRLMRTLVHRAQRDGFRAIEGSVVADNAAMLTLAKRLRFAVAAVPGDATAYLARREL
jgi:acetyltransferase